MALNQEQKALLGALLAVSRGERPAPPMLDALVERGLATEVPLALTDDGEHATSDLLVEDANADGTALAYRGTPVRRGAA